MKLILIPDIPSERQLVTVANPRGLKAILIHIQQRLWQSYRIAFWFQDVIRFNERFPVLFYFLCGTISKNKSVKLFSLANVSKNRSCLNEIGNSKKAKFMYHYKSSCSFKFISQRTFHLRTRETTPRDLL